MENEERIAEITKIADLVATLASFVETCGESTRELALSRTKLEEATFWLNYAIDDLKDKYGIVSEEPDEDDF